MERESDVSHEIKKHESETNNNIGPIKKIIFRRISTNVLLFPSGVVAAGGQPGIYRKDLGWLLNLVASPIALEVEIHDLDRVSPDQKISHANGISLLRKISDHEIGTTDNTSIIFWDINTCKPTKTIKLPKQQFVSIHSFILLQDGRLVIAGKTGKQDGNCYALLYYDINKKQMTSKSVIASEVTALLEFPVNRLIIGYENGQIILQKSKKAHFHLQDSEKITLTGHTARINSLLISESKKFLISASKDSTICLWDIDNGELLQTFAGHSDAVTAIGQLGNYLISGSLDKMIKIWDISNNRCIKTIEMADPISDLLLLSDKEFLYADSHVLYHDIYQIQFPVSLGSLLEFKKIDENVIIADITLAALQQQVLQNNDIPSAENHELTQEELFNKALEESKKVYEQLLDTTVENFKKSFGQDKAALEQRLTEDEKQLKALEDYTKNLETELQKNTKHDEIQERKLRELKIKQRILWKEHQIKVKQKRILDRFKNSPNLLLFYRTLQVCIQRLFLSCLSGSGGKVSVESGNLDVPQQGIELFGDICNIVPIAGPVVNLILKWIVGKSLEKIDGTRQENVTKEISSLLSLTELKELSETVAQQLTLWYEPILQNLATIEDEVRFRKDKKKNFKGKLKEGMKEVKENLQEAILKKKHQPAASKAAEFAIAWALDELFDDEKLKLNEPIDEQFIWIIITKKPAYKSDDPLLIRKTKQIADEVATSMSKALGKKTIKTKNGETWHLWEMYTQCGIKTETDLYSDNSAATYGYCNGISYKRAAEVAAARGLRARGENKKYRNNKDAAVLPSSGHLKQLNTLTGNTQKLEEKINKNEVAYQIIIDGLKTQVQGLKEQLADQQTSHQQEMDELKKTMSEEVQRQIQLHLSQATAKSTGTTFWNDSKQSGSAASQSQQAPNSSSQSQKQSRR